MSPNGPPPAPPEPQPYRIIAYPNYFLASLQYGDPVTVFQTDGPSITAPLMDATHFGITIWLADKLVHVRWERINRVEWSPPP